LNRLEKKEKTKNRGGRRRGKKNNGGISNANGMGPERHRAIQGEGGKGVLSGKQPGEVDGLGQSSIENGKSPERANIKTKKKIGEEACRGSGEEPKKRQRTVAIKFQQIGPIRKEESLSRRGSGRDY